MTVVRHPSGLVIASAATMVAGLSVVWTPAAGKKWRLQSVYVMTTSNFDAAGGPLVTIELRDGASAATGLEWTSSDAGTTYWSFGPYTLPGDGYIDSALVNTPLYVYLSTAVDPGYCRVMAMGSEHT